MAHLRPQQHLLTLWLTSLALVFAALMPMPGQNSGTAVNWAQMCTARGYVQMAVEQPADTGSSSQSSTACLWCSLHCGQAQLPSNRLELAVLVAPQPRLPSAPGVLPAPPRNWPAALSRAPPRQA